MESLSTGQQALLPGRESDPLITEESRETRSSVGSLLVDLRADVSRTTYEVVNLKWIDGWSTSMIATELGLTTAQVRSRTHRALKKLRRLAAAQL
jgi:DNA-directed RNA polymerase specialized sigma24 family protein